jgi:membrane-bound lytic murein transglycosylase B
MIRLGAGVMLGVVLAVAGPARAGEPASAPPGFAAWLVALRAEAQARGISERTLDAALTGIDVLPRVLALDRRQPESRLPYAVYVRRTVTPARVREGARLLREHRALLEEIGARYGVPPSLIVALWGVETDYGRQTGDFPVIAALATLAFDGRRSAFFRGELLDALTIVDDAAMPPDALRGSWAGAMGQPQFMPSSFRRYAVDHDGDGRRDIWTTPADVFASAANYLAQAGWRAGERWGHAVRLPDRFRRDAAARPLAQWRSRGLRRADGGDLPATPSPASLITPAGRRGPAFLVHTNYRVLLAWNRSGYFALAVGQLADRLDAT